MKCKHDYISLKDGSLDKYCVKCDKKFKQNALRVEPMQSSIPSPAPTIMRETIRINMGGFIGNVDIYKDRLEAEVNKQFAKQFDICLKALSKRYKTLRQNEDGLYRE